MTRKRYVKLLMSRGYSRNEANAKAQAVVAKGESYAYEYHLQFFFFDTLVRLISPATVALSKLNEAMRRVVEAAKRCAEDMLPRIAELEARLQRNRLT